MREIRKQVIWLLESGAAHTTFEQAIGKIPARLRGVRPPGAVHSPWEILEHMRIAQADILDFSVNPKYSERKFPDDYWPRKPAPRDAKAWSAGVKQFRADLRAMIRLVRDPKTDLFELIPHGTGQTILREALLVADHNAYHLGELVLVRRLLGIWESGLQ